MMAAKRDYYETLGIDKKADTQAIKKAYRKLAKKYHPDTNAGNPTAEEKFKEVTEAYNVLSNEEKKKLYDEFGFAGLEEGFSAEAARAAARSGGYGFNPFGGGTSSGPYTHNEFHFENGAGDLDADDLFSGIFGDFFSGGTGSYTSSRTSSHAGRRSRKGADVEAAITIDFEEAVFGCEKNISLHDPNTNSTQNLAIHIPAGIDSGKTIRLKGQGNPGVNGGAAGDILLAVTVRRSTVFEREGMDVCSTVCIPYTTAALGGKVRVHTLYGDVECNVKEGTQAGSKIRLRGKGIVSMKNKNQHGDHYVTVEIQVPKHLTPEERQVLQEYERLLETA